MKRVQAGNDNISTYVRNWPDLPVPGARKVSSCVEEEVGRLGRYRGTTGERGREANSSWLLKQAYGGLEERREERDYGWGRGRTCTRNATFVSRRERQLRDAIARYIHSIKVLYRDPAQLRSGSLPKSSIARPWPEEVGTSAVPSTQEHSWPYAQPWPAFKTTATTNSKKSRKN